MNIQLSDHFTYKKLLAYVLAPIAMMIFTSIYTVVDGLFVSNFVGKGPFTALNLIMPLYMIIGAIGFMIGAGGSAIIAVTLGELRKEDANKHFSFLIYFVAITGIVIAIIGELVLPYSAKLLKAEGDLYAPYMVYGRLLFIGLPFFMLQNVFQTLFSVAQKPTLGFIFCVVAGVTNIVLDAVLVAGLKWGIAGAAVATSASQVVGTVASLLYFSRENSSLLRLCKTKFEGKVLLKACANGSSEFVSNVAMSVVSIIFNLQLMKYAGEDGVAAYGVLMYLGFTFAAIYIGYSIGTAPIIGYNLGANSILELKNIFKKSIILMSIFGVVLTISANLLAYPLSKIFVGYDDHLLKMTQNAFHIYSFAFLFSGINIFVSALFTALNNGLISAIISFSRTLVLQILCVIILPIFLGITGIWLSLFVAEIIAMIISIIFIFAYRKKYQYM